LGQTTMHTLISKGYFAKPSPAILAMYFKQLLRRSLILQSLS
jgi:hypothetical protein